MTRLARRHTALVLPVLLAATACEPQPADPAAIVSAVDALDTAPSWQSGADPAHSRSLVTLRLDGREARAATGWSFAHDGVVPAEDADLVLTHSDCGARGRWVFVEGVHASVCRSMHRTGLEGCSPIEIGGSAPEIEPGEWFYVQLGGGELVSVQLVDRSETPFDWLDQDDVGFDVVLAAP